MIWSLFSKKPSQPRRDLPEVAFAPSLPDITKTEPVRAFQSAEAFAVFVRNVKSIGASAGLPSMFDYPNVLAVMSRATGRPIFFVTYEVSKMGTSALGAFAPSGHLNFGDDKSLLDPKAFVEMALRIVERDLGIRLVETARK